MSEYDITLPDGRVATVPMPTELTLKRPMSDAEARVAITKYVTKWVATALEPVIEPRPPWKQVVRDEKGQIDHVLDHPADPPASETAQKLGAEAAALYVSETEGWS